MKQYYLYFMMYAILGWIYEVFLETVVYGWGFTNRGVLLGPYCPVYGVGAFLFLFLVYPIIKNKNWKVKIRMLPVIFVSCMLLATILELLTSYLCEAIMGTWPWQTYANYRYNFQARIALSPSIRFGIGGIVFLYVLQPLFEKLVGKLSIKKQSVIVKIILTIFLTDMIVFVIKCFV